MYKVVTPNSHAPAGIIFAPVSNITRMVKYVRIYKAPQLKSKFKHSVTLSAATWPLRRLCYRPAVIFRRLSELLWPQERIRLRIQNICYFNFYFFNMLNS